MSEVWSQRAPWEKNAHARTEAGTACSDARQRKRKQADCVLYDPPKRFERRENARVPGQAARSPNFVRRP